MIHHGNMRFTEPCPNCGTRKGLADDRGVWCAEPCCRRRRLGPVREKYNTASNSYVYAEVTDADFDGAFTPEDVDELHAMGMSL